MLSYITLSVWSLCQYNMRCESVHPLLVYLLKKNNRLILYPLFTKPHRRFIGKNWKPKEVIPCSVNPSSWRLLETPQTGSPLCTLICESSYSHTLEEPPSWLLFGFTPLPHRLTIRSSECDGQFLALELLSVRNTELVQWFSKCSPPDKQH